MDKLGDFLTHPVDRYERRGWNDLDALRRNIRKGDVLLVEGDQRVSAIIKYLTQSSWSHSALYIGDELLQRGGEVRDKALESFGAEADQLVLEALMEGVIVSPLSKYIDFNIRLCRPHRLRPEHLKIILDQAVATLGWRYDVRNVFDLARHFIPVSLTPRRFKKSLRRFGSEASTEVICSSLIGQLFHSVGFPIAPTVTFPSGMPPEEPRPSWIGRMLRRRGDSLPGLFQKRHPTLLAPRDFDLSPYFEIIKFNLVMDGSFEYEQIRWNNDDSGTFGSKL